jgi:hypothetical protein
MESHDFETPVDENIENPHVIYSPADTDESKSKIPSNIEGIIYF